MTKVQLIIELFNFFNKQQIPSIYLNLLKNRAFLFQSISPVNELQSKNLDNLKNNLYICRHFPV